MFPSSLPLPQATGGCGDPVLLSIVSIPFEPAIIHKLYNRSLTLLTNINTHLFSFLANARDVTGSSLSLSTEKQLKVFPEITSMIRT